LKLKFKNGNSYLLESRTGHGASKRFSTLLNLNGAVEKAFSSEQVLFPFFPLEIADSYTFSDYARDTVECFSWLKNEGRLSTLVLRDAECCVNYDLHANMSVISRVVTIRNEIWGGFLVHGVLLAHRGNGIILAGASGVGKTTAASRMPADTWKQYSDDLTLVVCDKRGDYFAYPWPGPKAYPYYELRYNLSSGLPLKGMFLLVRRKEVQFNPIKKMHGIALLQHVVDQAFDIPDPAVVYDGSREMRKKRLENLSRFVEKNPVFELSLDMVDPFWLEIEKRLCNGTGS
jgi:SynChlorMet cassette protein ScmC